jgi:hypothetical protein
MARILIAGVMIVVAGAGTARADRIALKDGGVIEGRMVAETDREVVLEVLLSGKVIRIGLQADRIDALDRTVSVLDAYEAELKKADPESADAMAGLAAWCLERKWVERAETHLRAALLLAPDHARAGRLAASLGWSRDSNRWITGPERLRELGLEPVAGQWVTREDAQRLRKAGMDRRDEASRESERQGVAYHLSRAHAALDTARRQLAWARKAAEEIEAKRKGLEIERARLTSQIAAFKAREDAIRYEIARVEEYFLRASSGGWGSYGGVYVTCPMNGYTDALYRELSSVRRGRRDAEQDLRRVEYDIEACRLNRNARLEELDKAEQTSAWRGAEVDRLRSKAAELDRKPVPPPDADPGAAP